MSFESFDVLCLGVGLLVGFVTGWFSYRGRQIANRELAEERSDALAQNVGALQIELAKSLERIRLLEETFEGAETELGQERQFNISLHAELSRERTSRTHLEQKIETQKADLLQLQQRMTHELKALVQQVLEEKSQSLNEVNQASLNVLLQPISEKLQDFQQKIEEQHFRETRELIVLHNKLSNLESGRRNHHNGTPAAPPAAEIPPAPKEPEVPPETEVPVRSSSDFIEYIPPTFQSDAIKATASVIDVTKEESPGEGDGFHVFSPKQQGEIDNFLKRTLGRAVRKKPAG